MATRKDDPQTILQAARQQQQMGHLPAAVDILKQAVATHRSSPELRLALAQTLQQTGDFNGAIDAYRRVAELQPYLFPPVAELGRILFDQGRYGEAIVAWRKALALNPNNQVVVNGFIIACKAENRYDEAACRLEQHLRTTPGTPSQYAILAGLQARMGKQDSAVALYEKAFRDSPPLPRYHSDFLFVLTNALEDAQPLFAEHVRFAQRHAQPLSGQIASHSNDRNPARRLRIGYLSPDLRDHPVSFFLEPILAAHDRANFEIICYSDSPLSDAVTQRLRSYVDGWRDVQRLNDGQLASAIRNDRIDILVDLSVHANAGLRMLVLARKPAPVQVTYLGYAGTTGLPTVDWRITDPHVDPPGLTEACHSERLMRLPQTHWCYRPPADAPPISPPPALERGYVTFGCTNVRIKIAPKVLSLWGRILQAVPSSHLLLKSAEFVEEATRQGIRDGLASFAVTPDRIEFVGWSNFADYLAFHHRLDIVLDTYPFNGGTTSCHALWMGVPLVTLAGRTSVSRVGSSLLRNLGLPELIAETPDQYVDIAVRLANDLPRLADLRRTMRTRMQQSPLRDEARFVRHLEAAYRQMWQEWCASPSPAPTQEPGNVTYLL